MCIRDSRSGVLCHQGIVDGLERDLLTGGRTCYGVHQDRSCPYDFGDQWVHVAQRPLEELDGRDTLRTQCYADLCSDMSDAHAALIDAWIPVRAEGRSKDQGIGCP